MREIAQLLGVEDKPTDISVPKNLKITTMSRYNSEFPFDIAFPPQAMDNVMAEWLAKQGCNQCHIAGEEPIHISPAILADIRCRNREVRPRHLLLQRRSREAVRERSSTHDPVSQSAHLRQAA
jgi:bisphosphoglycerate-independent phosphoglycerate mutase (AlkP superfamily)